MILAPQRQSPDQCFIETEPPVGNGNIARRGRLANPPLNRDCERRHISVAGWQPYLSVQRRVAVLPFAQCCHGRQSKSALDKVRRPLGRSL